MAENVLGDNYYSTMDREYQANEEQLVAGVTAHEAAEGRFPQSVGSKIRMGADAVELQLTTEDVGKGWGAESYGKEARQDIKDLAEYNEVKIHSVHIPVQIPNLSGLGKEGFNEQVRDHIITEVRKHLNFAGDVSDGASVVIHTGEFQRPIAGKFRGFEAYPGEEHEAIVSLANKKTGDMALQIRSDMEIQIAKKTGEVDEYGVPKIKVETVTVNGYLDDINKKGISNFVKEHGIDPSAVKDATPRDVAGMAIYKDFNDARLTEQEASAGRFQSMAQHYSEQVRETEEQLKRIRASPGETVQVAEGLEIPKKEFIEKKEKEIKRIINERDSYLEYVRSSQAQIRKMEEDMKNTVPVKEVAMVRSADTLGQAGIIAFDTTKEKKLHNPLCMAPENISPDAFGSHPDEMIELVEVARKRMVELMTSPQITDVKGRPVERNPYFHEGISKAQAEKLAADHIKVTLDTQHLNMWRRHFERKAGETEESRDKRFNKWYVEQVEKLADKGVIGNIHLVDGMGLGHTHLPAGQGTFPVAEALEKLREKGYRGPISSEGHGEGPERQLTAAWEAVGKPTGLYFAATQRAQSWTDVENSYFGSAKRPPGYIVGDFAKQISNDFTLWSGIPLE